MKNLQIDNSWTLFLDRDGVLNNRIIGDYVRNVDQFVWMPGVLPALQTLTPLFNKTVVVTNQQGVGKGLMTQSDLDAIHRKMIQQAQFGGATIDKVFACTELASSNPKCRKPNTGMADQAKELFPEIDFSKAIMVGDSPSDIAFGKAKGMITVFIGLKDHENADFHFQNLWDFAEALKA